MGEAGGRQRGSKGPPERQTLSSERSWALRAPREVDGQGHKSAAFPQGWPWLVALGLWAALAPWLLPLPTRP